MCHGAITTHHSPAPDRVTIHEPATPLGYGQGAGRGGRPAQRGYTGGASPDEAKDEKHMGVGGEASDCGESSDGGGSLDGGSPDAATGRDWKDRREPHRARMPAEPHGARVPEEPHGSRVPREPHGARV